MRLLLPPSRTTVAGNSVTGVPVAIESRPAPIGWYTGTLFKALDVPSWGLAEHQYAAETLVFHDKAAGLVAAGSWAPLGFEDLSEDFLLDARSGEYRRAIRAPKGTWALRVVSEDATGRRLTISHWNKHHKGVLARALVRDRARVGSVNDLVAWSCAAGLRLEVVAEGELDLLV